MCVHALAHLGGQRTTWKTQFFLSSRWFLGMELRQPGLVALPAEPPHYPDHSESLKNGFYS